MSSSSHSPAAATAARTTSSSSAVRAAAKNGRPVRVYTAPGQRVRRTANRPRPAWSSRQASTMAREPMCFSSQMTSAMPSAA